MSQPKAGDPGTGGAPWAPRHWAWGLQGEVSLRGMASSDEAWGRTEGQWEEQTEGSPSPPGKQEDY